MKVLEMSDAEFTVLCQIEVPVITRLQEDALFSLMHKINMLDRETPKDAPKPDDKPLDFPEKGCIWGDLEMTPWPVPVKRECATCAGVGDVFTGTPCGTCYGHSNWRGA